jgi:predicted enzyme related to lactoylglutathione lyase
MQLQVVKFMLYAQDMGRGVAFYRDVVGLEVALETEHWSELKHGDAVVALHGGGTGEQRKTGLSFQVADVEGACAELAAGGGLIVKAPESRPGEPIKLAECADPEGNVFMVTEYVPQS